MTYKAKLPISQKDKLTRASMMESLSYDPETGVFTWLRSTGKGFPGKIAGRIASRGYRMISLQYGEYVAARLAWLFMTGRWPSDQIDHINGIKDDDRFCNLREATAAENIRNRVMPRGKYLKGAKAAGAKWVSEIGFNNVKVYLGRFATEKEAHAAYVEAAKLLHGQFSSMNRDKGA